MRAFLLIAATSAGLVTLQFFILGRYPSVDDFLFNALGGAAGIAMAYWIGRRLGGPGFAR